MVGPLQGSAHPRAPQGHQACCHSPPGKEGDHFNLSRITLTPQPFFFVTLFVTVNIYIFLFYLCLLFSRESPAPESHLAGGLADPQNLVVVIFTFLHFCFFVVVKMWRLFL